MTIRGVLGAAAAGLLLAGCAALGGRDDGRIIGGAPASLGQYPYQVEILWKVPLDGPEPKELRQHRCGGTLVSPDPNATTTVWVVTAAHCVYSTSFAPATIAPRIGIRAGFVTLADTSVPVRDVAAVIPYPGFIVPAAYRHGDKAAPIGGGNAPGADYLVDLTNDLALIRLAQPVALGANIAAIPIGVSPAVGRVIVSGWGVADQAGGGDAARGVAAHGTSSPVLMAVPLSVIPCRPDRGRTTPPPTHFCAGEPGKDSCVGDSGGPAVLGGAEPRLVGVVSRRPFDVDTCGGRDVQTRYTKFDPLIEQWLRQTMAKGS